MDDALHRLLAALAAQEPPVCAALTPFRVTDVRPDNKTVRFLFDPQPAFGNHFGNVQGGFAAAMADAVLSITLFAFSEEWMPTVEMKASFVAPLPIGPTEAEGQVLRIGSAFAFAEASLFRPDGAVAVRVSATTARARR